MAYDQRKKYLIIVFVLTLGLIALKFLNTQQQNAALISDNTLPRSENSSCINCHGALKGMSPHHQEIQCISCHQGDNTHHDKDSSHSQMINIPGNLEDAKETCALCHPKAYEDLQTSLMTSNSGIIAVDKYIFGESDSPDLNYHINELGHSAADTHLRNLCSHCHLGNPKKDVGPINELSRGGGCNACHLNYSKDHSMDSLHPSLDLNISNDHCFGCHSRSGRISTNYEGWHETLIQKDSIPEKGRYRVLMDDRVFEFVQADVHHTAGLDCIDCHNYEDLMGDGKKHNHEEEAVKIACEDCHFSSAPKTIQYDELNFTHKRILNIRNNGNKIFLATSIDSTPLLNSMIDQNERAFLNRKSDGKRFKLSPPSSSCNRNEGHQDISCSACHNNWAPQCIGCHSDFDPNAKGYDLYKAEYMNGSWIEYAAEFLAEAPGLGVRKNDEKREIQASIPGMIMTLDQSAFSKDHIGKISFHRLFAPVSPHTIRAKGRECKSCHTNPVALGYGRGQLIFDVKEPNPQWKFNPEYENLEDGLPSDAWIAFLDELDERRYSTRIDFLPFSREEQERILTIGACFSCHEEDSKVMLESLKHPFKEYKKGISSYCVLPVFE